MVQNSIICSKWYNLEAYVWITSKLGTQFVVLNWFEWVLLSRKYQVSAKCCKMLQKYCKITLHAANDIIWKQMHSLLPNLIHRGGWLFLIDSDKFCLKKNIRLLQNAAKYWENSAKWNNLQQMVYFGNQFMDYFQTWYTGVVCHSE